MYYVYGDPSQLPPILKNEDNHLLDKPHIFLDEIMRQAAESEIIQLTMKIRDGEKVDEYKGKEVQIFDKSELSDGMLQWANQVICATNSTREGLNTHIRHLQGRDNDPEVGDKIICLKNSWDYEGTDGNPLINGTIGYITKIKDEIVWVPPYVKCGMNFFKIFRVDFKTDEGEEFYNIPIDRNLLMFNEPTIDAKLKYRLLRSKIKNSVPIEFAYGYAITCHKAQGGEWKNVLVIEENFPFDKEEHKHWVYTGTTRSSSKLVMIKK